MRGMANLNGLRALEAVVRHRSYIHAADELHVTPAAVGQQIRALEAWLGMALFERNRGSGARLAPLPHTEAAMADLTAGFALLDRGLRRIQRAGSGNVVRISTSPAFGTRWLVARLGQFQQAHPEIDVRLEVTEKVVDLAAGEADCTIRYGIGPWSGLSARRLCGETLFPAASPALAARLPAAPRPEDLRALPLIEDCSGQYMPDFPDWRRWFARYAGNGGDPRPAIQVNLTSAALQAAMDGAGAVLARSFAARDEIDAGRLVRLLPDLPGLVSPASYWLLVAAGRSQSQPIRELTDWIVEQLPEETG